MANLAPDHSLNWCRVFQQNPADLPHRFWWGRWCPGVLKKLATTTCLEEMAYRHLYADTETCLQRHFDMLPSGRFGLGLLSLFDGLKNLAMLDVRHLWASLQRECRPL